jgi:hypothetical protein
MIDLLGGSEAMSFPRTLEGNPVRRLFKVTAISLSLSLSVLASYLTYYDLTAFQPAWARTRLHMQSAPSLVVSPLLEKHLQSAYGQSLEFLAGNILLRQSAFGGDDGWRSFLWGKLADFHLSAQEQVTVVVSLAHMGSNRYGFPAASMAMYGKPIEQLSPAESATLVALASAPSYYESHPEMLVKRRDQLLATAGKNAF